MTIVETTAAVDEQGNVTVAVPAALRGSGRQVRVVLSSAEPAPAAVTQADWVATLDRAAGSSDWTALARPQQPVKPAADMTSAEWTAFVERTAGCNQDVTFVRPEQLPIAPAPEFD